MKRPVMPDDEMWTRLARYLAGESVSEEQRFVEQWLDEDAGHRS